MEYYKYSLEPIWFRWVYKGHLLESAPEEIKQAYNDYLERQKNRESKESKDSKESKE